MAEKVYTQTEKGQGVARGGLQVNDQSEHVNELAAALVKLQAQCAAARRTAENPFYKSHYADLMEVWQTVKPHMSSCGLAISQTTAPSESATCVDIVTTLLHTSGQWIKGRLTVPYGRGKDNSIKNDPQGMGSALTYGRRYALAAILGVVTDEDDDGNGASQPPTERPAPRATAAPSATPARAAQPGALVCPLCGGECWDNRDGSKKGPKITCKNRKWDAATKTASGCDGQWWGESDYQAAVDKANALHPLAASGPSADDLRKALAASLNGFDWHGAKPPADAATLVSGFLMRNWGKNKIADLTPQHVAEAYTMAKDGIDWTVANEEVPF